MVVGATADPVVLAQIRAKARSILDALERETEDDEELHPSWVRGGRRVVHKEASPHLTASCLCMERAKRYSFTPTTVRGTDHCTCGEACGQLSASWAFCARAQCAAGWRAFGSFMLETSSSF